MILGENLNNYLFKKENREFFHPEIQAELDFGIEQSKDCSADEMLHNLDHFLRQDSEWEAADEANPWTSRRATQRTLGAAEDLANAVLRNLSTSTRSGMQIILPPCNIVEQCLKAKSY